MKRREALKRMAIALTGAAAATLGTSCKDLFSPYDDYYDYSDYYSNYYGNYYNYSDYSVYYSNYYNFSPAA